MLIVKSLLYNFNNNITFFKNRNKLIKLQIIKINENIKFLFSQFLCSAL